MDTQDSTASVGIQEHALLPSQKDLDRTLRLMVVDDNVDAADSLAILLAAQGLNV
jgi:hypothetical protein